MTSSPNIVTSSIGMLQSQEQVTMLPKVTRPTPSSLFTPPMLMSTPSHLATPLTSTHLHAPTSTSARPTTAFSSRLLTPPLLTPPLLTPPSYAAQSALLQQIVSALAAQQQHQLHASPLDAALTLLNRQKLLEQSAGAKCPSCYSEFTPTSLSTLSGGLCCTCTVRRTLFEGGI